MSSDVMTRGVRGGGITIAGQLLKALVQMLSVVVLARMLGPDDFGLIAMVTVAVALGELVLDFGLTASALRAPTLSRAQASNLFWINVALGLTLATALVVASHVIAAGYGEPRLAPIVQVIALALVMHGAQAQIQVQLARAQKYSAIALTDLGSQILAFAAAVTTAALGWGYWALVTQVLVNTATLALTRFIAARWIPSLPKRRVGSRHLIRSGVHYALAQLLTFGASNIDTMLIGARWNATSLGYYNRAFQLLTLPLSRLLTPLTNVAVPTLTRMRSQASPTVMNVRFEQAQTLLALPVAGLFAVAAGSADSLIPLLLGPEWSPAVPLFQILAAGGALRALSHVTYWLFLIIAPSKSFLTSSIVTKCLTMALIVIGALHSIAAVAALYTLGLFLNWVINLLWLRHSSGLPFVTMVISGMRTILISIPAAAAAHMSQHLPIETQWGLCALQLLVGTVVFACTACVTPQGRRDVKLVAQVLRQLATRIS